MRHWLIAIIPTACLLCAACSGSAPRWRAGLSYHDLSYDSLCRLREARIECVEVTLSDILKLPPGQHTAKCAEIRENARKAGVELWSVHIPYGKAWDISVTDAAGHAKVMKSMREAIELCALLAPKKAIIHASAEPIRDSDRRRRLEVCRKALAELTPGFSKIHVQLALEDLPRTCLGNTSDEILWLINGIGGLGVCFDTNHLLKETPEQFVRKVGPHIVTLHVADYDGKDERHWMAGEGIVNWPVVIRELQTAGYSGPWLYETGKHKSGAKLELSEYVRFLKRM